MEYETKLSQSQLNKYIRSRHNRKWSVGLIKNRATSYRFEYVDMSRLSFDGFPFKGTVFRNCNFFRSYLPNPLVVLQASWGSVSDELCIELMKFDAQNHPFPQAFDIWKKDGDCPYSVFANKNKARSISIERAVNFKENKELWNHGLLIQKVKSPLELMLMLFEEKQINY
jgi:hypothetical protein